MVRRKFGEEAVADGVSRRGLGFAAGAPGRPRAGDGIARRFLTTALANACILLLI